MVPETTIRTIINYLCQQYISDQLYGNTAQAGRLALLALCCTHLIVVQ